MTEVDGSGRQKSRPNEGSDLQKMSRIGYPLLTRRAPLWTGPVPRVRDWRGSKHFNWFQRCRKQTGGPMIGPQALDGSKRSRNQESVFAGPKLNADACKGCSRCRPWPKSMKCLISRATFCLSGVLQGSIGRCREYSRSPARASDLKITGAGRTHKVGHRVGKPMKSWRSAD